MPQPKEQKREAAKVRQAAYDKLSVKQKLARLDNLFGEGLGAKRERARLVKTERKLEAAEVAEAFKPLDTSKMAVKKAKKNGKGK